MMKKWSVRVALFLMGFCIMNVVLPLYRTLDDAAYAFFFMAGQTGITFDTARFVWDVVRLCSIAFASAIVIVVLFFVVWRIMDMLFIDEQRERIWVTSFTMLGAVMSHVMLLVLANVVSEVFIDLVICVGCVFGLMIVFLAILSLVGRKIKSETKERLNENPEKRVEVLIQKMEACYDDFESLIGGEVNPLELTSLINHLVKEHLVYTDEYYDKLYAGIKDALYYVLKEYDYCYPDALGMAMHRIEMDFKRLEDEEEDEDV